MTYREELRKDKQAVRNFLQLHYTTARLLEIVDHIRSGNMHFVSCCCLIGATTADHKLKSNNIAYSHQHYFDAHKLSGAYAAENAYNNFGYHTFHSDPDNGLRNRRALPLVLSELRRRYHAGVVVIREAERKARS
jgi:hypothetical protein